MKILLLEDDAKLSAFVSEGLERAGHSVDRLEDGRDAVTAALTRDYDMILLDRMVPGLDGLSVLKALRAAGTETPILFLTAMGDIEDRVEGLEAGADDYLPKPFALSELIARMGVITRRGQGGKTGRQTVIRHKDIEIDRLAQTAKRQGQTLPLSSLEFKLLDIFMRNPGRVLTKNMLLEQVWNMDFDPSTNVVETHMSRLRAKLEKPFDDRVITTVRGSGYRLDG